MMTDTIPIKIKYKYYTGTLDITMGKVKYGITEKNLNGNKGSKSIIDDN